MFRTPLHDLWIEFRKHYRQVCIQNGIKANNAKALKEVFLFNLEAVTNYMNICNTLSPLRQLGQIQIFFLRASQTIIISPKKKRTVKKELSHDFSVPDEIMTARFKHIAKQPEHDFSVPDEVMTAWFKHIAKRPELDFSVPDEVMQEWRKKITKVEEKTELLEPCEYCKNTNPCSCQFSWNVDLLLH